LDKDIFKALKKGQLSSDEFANKKPKDDDDHIIYKKGKGTIFYDPDGSGDKKMTKFAKLDQDEGLSADDFFVI
jgi:hypothetical protein